MKRPRAWLAVAATVWAGLALAQDDPGTDARQLGAAGNSQAASGATAAPSSYPGYSTSNPPQTTYYNSGAAIQGQAQAAAAAAPAGDASQVVTTNALSGPHFSFAPNDPILTQGAATASQATTLATNYQGCQALNVQTPPAQQSTTASCAYDEVPSTVNCTSQLQTTCPANAPNQPGLQAGGITSNAAYSYNFPTLTVGTPGDNYWSGGCMMHDQLTTFTIDNPALLAKFALTYAGYDDYMSVLVNGHLVYNGPYGGDMLAVANGAVQYDSSGKTGPCDLGTNWRYSPNVDLRPLLTNGTNTIEMKVAVGGGGEGWSTYDVEDYPDCSANDHWVQSCPSGSSITGCTQRSQICTDGPGMESIDGMPQYRVCWTEQQSYLCETPQQQEQAQCGQYLQQGCQQTGSACVATDSAGNCTRYQQTFQCPTGKPGMNQVDICGSDLYCPNGNCTSDVEAAAASPSNVTQMAQASSWLQAAQEAAKDNTNSTGTFSFFLGQGEQCTESAVGFSDCCSASGWGSSVGLASCSAQEKQLGIARQAGQTHEVGTYSSGSFVLKTTYDVFCVFNSMLSRIIQEQGRQQLGIGWGTPKSPNCQALTAAQLSSLDFNKMDFSEFYAYAESQASTGLANREPDASIQQRTQQDIQYLQQNPGATSGQAATTQP